MNKLIPNPKWGGILAIGVGFAMCGAVSQAQQPGKVRRVGFLANVSVPARMESFRRGLRELGYSEGKDIAINYRVSEGNRGRLTDLATELVRLNVDVIVTAGGSSTQAAKSATKAIPIVMMNVSDPIEVGFVASLAKPGGNITGLTTLAPELGGKRLELLKEIVPRLSRLAVLENRAARSRSGQKEEIEAATKAMDVQVVSRAEVDSVKDLENAFADMARKHVDAVILLQGPILGFHRHRIVELAAKNRLPAAYFDREFVEAGGLMSYAPSFPDLYRRAARYVDKILKGPSPPTCPSSSRQSSSS